MHNGKLIFVRRRRALRARRRRGGANLLARTLLIVLVAIVVSGVLAIAAGAGTVAAVWAFYTRDLPDPEDIQIVEQEFETTRFYDRTGQTVIYEMVNPLGDRIWVDIEDIPEHVKQATIAIEDRNFYTNPGINVRGLARAFWANLRGESIQGGSSITQQLVKNVLIPPEERYERSYNRKIKEVILSLAITRRFSKDQILEWYLNRIFYGHLAYGIESAAQIYFGKHVQELTVAEAAMLAALPQYPMLNPIDNWDWAKRRQEIVLDQMVEAGFLTPEEAEAAKREEIHVQEQGIRERFDVLAPHFSLYAASRLQEILPPEVIARGGLRVYTTIDLEMQSKAEELLRAQVKKLEEEGRDAHNGAFVAIRPRTGEILAMVGSVDYWDESIDGEVNCAIAERQPGSSFKPFTYVTAFAQGYTPATMILDVRTCPNPDDPSWCPENYSRTYHGPVSIRKALANSYNIPAVKVMQMVGVSNVIKTAHKMGITTLRRDPNYYGLALTLGGGEVKLLDMVYAFSVFANNGTMLGMPVPESRLESGFRELDPVAILRVEDRDGNILWQYTQPEAREILSPQLAYLINNVLSDNNARLPAFGPNNKLHLDDRPVAAKTGTTNGWHDAWTIGYTPQLAVGVWIGNTDNEPMKNAPGAYAAAPVWHDFMEWALKDEPVMEFQRPPGIVEKVVCAVSGLLPNEHCPHTVREIFIEGTEPTMHCNIHQAFQVNKETGKLATVFTPPELVETRVYEIYPPEAADWVREAGIPQPPTEYDDYGPSRASEDVAILEPQPYSYIRKGVVIKGNARNNVQFWRLEFGQGLNPSAWIQIGGDHPYEVSEAPMDYWDVSGLNGLYTLQLTVVGHDQSIRRDTIQVTVDNISPTIRMANPEPNEVYVMEEDEWVNIQADATDNLSMDRVEFFLDGEKFAVSTVPPYNQKWTIVMSDTVPQHVGPPVQVTMPITMPDGTVVERTVSRSVITATRTVTMPDGTVVQEPYPMAQVLYDPATGAWMQWFSNGMGIIADSHGYTETHVVYAVAYDAAGNKVESERVRFFVTHKKPENETSALVGKPVAWLGADLRRWRWWGF